MAGLAQDRRRPGLITDAFWCPAHAASEPVPGRTFGTLPLASLIHRGVSRVGLIDRLSSEECF
jgi:hypothetical protein